MFENQRHKLKHILALIININMLVLNANMYIKLYNISVKYVNNMTITVTIV